MPEVQQESTQVAEALVRLSTAMESLQARYEASERANRRIRLVVLVVITLLAVLIYKTFAPIGEQIGQLPRTLSQALPGMRTVSFDPETAAAERQRLMEVLSPQERARIEAFEQRQQWVSDFIASSENFDPGATIALFLSNMAESVEVMPGLYTEVRSMTEAVRFMNSEMRTMNEKMSSIPVLANEVQGMHAQMTALPVLANDVKGMHFYMSTMARDMDSTLGEAGRMMPWNW